MRRERVENQIHARKVGRLSSKYRVQGPRKIKDDTVNKITKADAVITAKDTEGKEGIKNK